MASNSNPRRLSELLDEQQEPFGLEVYLRERGCKITSLDFEGEGFGLHGRRRKVRAWVLQLLPLRLKEWSFGDVVKKRWKHEKRESTEFNSFSDNGSSQSQSSQQNDEDNNTDNRMVKWRMIEDSKQCSPISVLDEIELISNVTFSGQGLREHNHNHTPSRLSFSFPNLKKATEESIFSATLWELFIHKKEVVSSSKRHCVKQMNSMKAMKQSRKLLLVESSHGRQRKKENFKIWDKQSVDGMKINKLVRSEMVSLCQKDDELDDFREEIVKEIGDEILDEIIDLYFL